MSSSSSSSNPLDPRSGSVRLTRVGGTPPPSQQTQPEWTQPSVNDSITHKPIPNYSYDGSGGVGTQPASQLGHMPSGGGGSSPAFFQIPAVQPVSLPNPSNVRFQFSPLPNKPVEIYVTFCGMEYKGVSHDFTADQIKDYRLLVMNITAVFQSALHHIETTAYQQQKPILEEFTEAQGFKLRDSSTSVPTYEQFPSDTSALKDYISHHPQHPFAQTAASVHSFTDAYREAIFSGAKGPLSQQAAYGMQGMHGSNQPYSHPSGHPPPSYSAPGPTIAQKPVKPAQDIDVSVIENALIQTSDDNTIPPKHSPKPSAPVDLNPELSPPPNTRSRSNSSSLESSRSNKPSPPQQKPPLSSSSGSPSSSAGGRSAKFDEAQSAVRTIIATMLEGEGIDIATGKGLKGFLSFLDDFKHASKQLKVEERVQLCTEIYDSISTNREKLHIEELNIKVFQNALALMLDSCIQDEKLGSEFLAFIKAPDIERGEIKEKFGELVNGLQDLTD